jgi:hypothetical protein
MKTKTRQQIKIILNDRKLFAGMLLIVVGLFFTGVPLFMDKVHSKSDLVEISATLRNCSFDEHRGPRYHTYLYYLYLNNYPNTFQISADFVPYFDKDYFEKTVQSGDTLHVFISRHDYAAIDYQEKVKLFGIYKDNTTYYLWAYFYFCWFVIVLFQQRQIENKQLYFVIQTPASAIL